MFSFKQTNKREYQTNNNSLWMKLALNFLAIVIAILSLSPTSVSASRTYFLNFTYNPSTRQIVANSSMSDVGSEITNQSEIQFGANYLYPRGGGDRLFHLVSDDDTSIRVIKEMPTIETAGDYFSDDRDSDYKDADQYTLPFSFPGRHVGTGAFNSRWLGGDSNYARDADSTDQQQSYWVGQMLTSGFNEVFGRTHAALYGSDRGLANMVKLANEISTLAVTSDHKNYEVDGTLITVAFSEVSDDEYNEHPESEWIDKAYFRKVNVTGPAVDGGIRDMIVPVAVNKGYGSDESYKMHQYLSGQQYMEYADEDVYSISWQHMVMQATKNAQMGVLTQNANELASVGRVEEVVTNMLSGIVSSLRGWLGMQTITDLVFNKGIHGATSVRGTIPNSMGDVADFVYFLVMILSLLLILGSFVSLLIKSNLSVINPQMRLDMKDSIFNILVTFFLLVVFNPIWNSLMILNEQLVEYFFGISSNVTDIGMSLTTAGGGGGLGVILLSIAFLIVEIWFNFYYIVRALTIMVLYMAAPLMITSIAYGGRFKQIFENWLKELLGALFSQSIQAAILGSVFAGLSKGLGSSLMWQFVIIISIIPLTNLFRKTILQLGGDSIGQTAERAEKGFLTTAALGSGVAIRAGATAGKTAVGAARIGGEFASKYKGRSPKNNSSGGSDGGGSGNGIGSSSAAGKTALGDEVSDESGGSVTGSEIQAQNLANEQNTAQANKEEINRADAQEHGDGVASAGQGLRDAMDSGNKLKDFGRRFGGAAKDTLKSEKTKEIGKETLKDVGSTALDAGGAMLTAGAMIGDVATDGGSSQAVLAGKRLVGNKRKSGGYKGSNRGPAQGGAEATPEPALMDYAYAKANNKRLTELNEGNISDDNGELLNLRTPQGKDIMTSSVRQMEQKQGTSNVQTHGANKEYQNGSTTMNIQPSNESLKENFDTFADLSERKMSGQALTDEESQLYDNIRQGSGVSHISKVDDDNYQVTMDHEALGWDEAESDGEFYVAKANPNERKTLPNFNEESDIRIQNFNNGTAQVKETQHAAEKENSEGGETAQA